MIEFPNGGILVQSADELPRPSELTTLFMDLETTSRDPKLDSLNPWHHCWVAGIAVTWDDHKPAYYVPVGHHDPRWNLPRDVVAHWVRNLVDRATKWTNHNVKYDAHALYNDLRVDGSHLELTCTIVSSKLLDSDRIYKGGYGLDALSKAWLSHDIGHYEQKLQPYLGRTNKDYGRIPADILGDYACQDVLTNRWLDRYVTGNMPAESLAVWDTEREMTKVLIAMERRGLLVRTQDIMVKKAHCLMRMVAAAQHLQELVGYPVLPTSSKDCYDVLCNRYGLPVIAWTNEDDPEKVSNPSFDHDALIAYQQRVDTPPEIIDLMLEYKDRSNMSGLMDNFLRQGIACGDGLAVMHPTHNQCVRTGRMSVSDPNQMALSPEAKALIVPGPGMAFLSSDASQIEFRLLCHIAQDPAVIKAYNDNPDVDFHAYVAKMCGIDRGPAKTTNFAIAFGQGQKSTVAQLSVNKKIVEAIMPVIKEMIDHGEISHDQKDDMFKRLARQRGESVYDKYHETFPLMRVTAREAASVCRHRGHVRNVRGRRRHLPREHSNKALNTLAQSGAADIIKERMVELHKQLQRTGIEIVAQVHDEILMVGPIAAIEDPRTQRDIIAILEDVHILRVPLRFKFGTSRENWKRACKGPEDGGEGDKSIPLEEVALAGRLEHLRYEPEEVSCG